jgi:hypothetical protein
MTVAELQLPRHYPSTVFVHVAGGQETEVVINMPQISSDAFRLALVATIEGSRLFARALPQAPADYRLEISIVEAKKKGALSTDATMTARWKLIRSSDGKGVFNEFIESIGKSKFTIGPARIRHSLESAGRENIKLGLTKLSQLDLP